jgi:circadian clock protein KaiB
MALRKPKPSAAQRSAVKEDLDFWQLRLYIAGKTRRAEEALQNLETICETHLLGRYRIEVVDLLLNPQLARGDQIFAVPTVVRQLPPPVKKIIGDLSNVERVLVGLDLRPVALKRGT